MEREGYSESALLQGVSSDAETAFVVRIERHPAQRADWLWIHAFAGGECFSYSEVDLPGTPETTDPEANGAAYRAGERASGVFATFIRSGRRAAPERAAVEARTFAHRRPEPLHGPGLTTVKISASLAPESPSGPSLAGRAETLGQVRASLELGGVRTTFSGFGHWQERHQSTSRFTMPFSQLSLRGSGLAVVAARTPAGSSGFAIEADRTVAVRRLLVSAPAPRRAIVIELTTGEALEGVLEATYRYSVPIDAARRLGSVVHGGLEGRYVVGTLGDWLVDSFPPEIER